MPLARLVVTAVRVQGRSKSEVARDYQVSRRWVHELVKRFDAEGEAGLAPGSRRPWTSPQRTPQAPCEEVILLRKTLTDQGLDAGAHTIAYHLTQRHGGAPAPSTIWRILSRRGFVTPQPHKRPGAPTCGSRPRCPTSAGRPTSPTGGWQLAGTSRSSTWSTTTPACWSPATPGPPPRPPTWWPASTTPLQLTGSQRRCLPTTVRSSPPHLMGAVAARSNWSWPGWRSPTGTPAPTTRRPAARSNASHQTLKRWLGKQPRAATVAELQAQLDQFAGYYNHVRPHRATPLSRWAPRSRNRIPEPATRSATVRETSTSPGWAAAATLAPIWTAIPGRSAPTVPTSPVCRPTRISRPKLWTASRIAHTADRTGGTGKVAKKPSPVVATLRPPNRSSSARRSTWWASSSARQLRSPSREACSVIPLCR
jgi:transposase